MPLIGAPPTIVPTTTPPSCLPSFVTLHHHKYGTSINHHSSSPPYTSNWSPSFLPYHHLPSNYRYTTMSPHHLLSLFGAPPPTIVPTTIPPIWSPSSKYRSYHQTTSCLYLEPLLQLSFLPPYHQLPLMWTPNLRTTSASLSQKQALNLQSLHRF